MPDLPENPRRQDYETRKQELLARARETLAARDAFAKWWMAAWSDLLNQSHLVRAGLPRLRFIAPR